VQLLLAVFQLNRRRPDFLPTTVITNDLHHVPSLKQPNDHVLHARLLVVQVPIAYVLVVDRSLVR